MLVRVKGNVCTFRLRNKGKLRLHADSLHQLVQLRHAGNEYLKTFSEELWPKLRIIWVKVVLWGLLETYRAVRAK